MEFYVLNRNLEKVAIIDNFASAIWNRKYNEVGDFELYLPVSEDITEVIQNDYFIQKADDDTVMIIKSIKMQSDDENGDYMTISGPSIESILGQRIIWYQTTVEGLVEDCIYELINTNCIAPNDSFRALPNFVIGSRNNFTETMSAQYSTENLLTVICQICQTYSIGFKITFEDGKFVFSLYKGVDRSYNQDQNQWVVFSSDFDNLLSSEYSMNSETYKNAALVGGAGEGLYRTFSSYGSSAGFNRHEMFVDASNTAPSNEMTFQEYWQILSQRGKEELTQNKLSKDFESMVDTTGYIYGVDYKLGDVIQIATKYGVSAVARIVAITENEDESGFKIYPTFSVWEVE